MKKTLIFLFVSFLMAACVSENETVQSPAESQYARDVAIINSMGYDTTDIYQISDGYVVEGDILLTRKHIDGYEAHQAQQTRQTFNLFDYKVSEEKQNIVVEYNTGVTYNIEHMEAIRYWNEKSKCNIVLSCLVGDATIEVIEDNFYINGTFEYDTLTLLHTTPPDYNGNPGQIKINKKCNHLPEGGLPNEQVVNMFLHAIGHAIGFGHTQVEGPDSDPEIGGLIFGTSILDSKSIMVKESNPLKWNGFSENDIKAFQAKYPKPEAPKPEPEPEPDFNHITWEWNSEYAIALKTNYFKENKPIRFNDYVQLTGSLWTNTTGYKALRVKQKSTGEEIATGITGVDYKLPYGDYTLHYGASFKDEYGDFNCQYGAADFKVWHFDPTIVSNVDNSAELDISLEYYIQCEFDTNDPAWSSYTATATLINQETNESVRLSSMSSTKRWRFRFPERGTYKATITINNGTETKTAERILFVKSIPTPVYYKIESRFESETLNPELYTRYYLEFYSDAACTQKITSTMTSISFKYSFWRYHYDMFGQLDETLKQYEGRLVIPGGSSSFDLPYPVFNGKFLTLDQSIFEYIITDFAY